MPVRRFSVREATIMAAMGSMAGGRSGMGPMAGSVADLGVSVASYPTYAQAQRAVDYLSDNQFPVDRTAIVGSDLSLVEKVVGRLTTQKSALSGALSGGWFGLFIGLLFGLFSRRNWFEVVFTGLVIGAVWGAIFGAIAHRATRGMRDFISRSALAAGSYEVMVQPDSSEQARTMLANIPAQ
jgi:heat induced stress protein YflT